jgi:hypothetical protein
MAVDEFVFLALPQRYWANEAIHLLALYLGIIVKMSSKLDGVDSHD